MAEHRDLVSATRDPYVRRMVQHLSRRHFVRATAFAVATGALVTTSCTDSDGFGNAEPADLLRTLGEVEVARIGAAYLTAAAGAVTAETLDTAITAARRTLRRWPWSPLPSAADVITAEFEAGRTVLADGWLLAETEARLAALVHLRRLPRAH